MAASNNALRLVQVNLQHCKTATDLLAKKLNNYECCLALISEPYVVRSRCKGLGASGYSVHQGARVGRTRTCIATKGVDFLYLQEFSSSDLTAGIMEFVVRGRPTKVAVGSVYIPGDTVDPPSREVDRFVGWCERNQLPLLLGGDFNAKHVLWGSAATDRRGRSIEQYLSANNLEVVNRGSAPTFCNGRHWSVIDVTVASPQVARMVEDWKVSPEETMSDHKYIEFRLAQDAIKAPKYRNPKATDWAKFREVLQHQIGGRITTIRTEEELEQEVNVLTSALAFAFETACPVKERKRAKQVPWWNAEISRLRSSTNSAYFKALRTKAAEDWTRFRELKRELKSQIRKSKRENWRKFCEDTSNVPALGRLQRILRKQDSGELGMLRKDDGSYTSSKEELLNHLFEVHFPGSQNAGHADPSGPPSRRSLRRNKEFAESFVKLEKVEWAIGTFQPFKSPGPDGVFPALLQQGKDTLAPILTRIFRAIIKLAYIPEAWRHARVVFLPKTGRATYDVAKSFRPICLTSFCLKVLERLMDIYIRSEISEAGGLHPRNHAYRAGRSTESAVHDAVCVIERALSSRQYCLGVFLDIQGAFDNACFKGIVRALKRFRVHGALVDLVGRLLRSRTVSCSLAGTEACRQVTRGCPQGGVLSPLLWNVLIEELLKEMDNSSVFCQFYADDGTLLVRSGSLKRVSSSMQRGLRVVERWCRRNDMEINPAKTEMVLFTRKRNRTGLTAPIVFGQRLTVSDSVKYLGIVLDSKLSWRLHVEARCAKATTALFLCRRAVGRAWGLQPRAMLWIYEVVIKPMILYGAVAWWHRADRTMLRGRLERVQRVACLMVTGCFKTTPTAAMETFLDLLPLFMEVQVEALASCKRLARCGLWSEGWGHCSIRVLSDLITEFDFPEDVCPKTVDFLQLFEVVISKEETARRDHDRAVADGDRSTLTCYTDGSRMDSTGWSGAGYYVLELGIRESISLGSYTTVFQAEVKAISECVSKLLSLGLEGRSVRIYSDSQAALRSLRRFEVLSASAKQTKQELNQLAALNKVELSWISGHSGVDGNEIADVLARAGSSSPMLGPEPAMGVSTRLVRTSIRKCFKRKHSRYWSDLISCRMSRMVVKEPSAVLAKKLLGCSRKNLRAIFGMYSGHNGLGAHLHRMGLIESPLCSLCGESEESSFHVLCECPALVNERILWLGTAETSPENLATFPPSALLGLGGASGLWQGFLGGVE